MLQPVTYNQRTSIRLGAIAALTNSDIPPYPTMAEDRVFDSRQDPILHTREQPEIPMVSVYTDSDKMEPIDMHTRGAWPLNHVTNLVLELSMTGTERDRRTDSELEAALDVFEAQVLNALLNPASEAAQRWHSTFTRVHSVESHRLANATHDHRLAQRDLVFAVEYQDRCQDWRKAFPDFERVLAKMAIDTHVIAEVNQEIQV